MFYEVLWFFIMIYDVLCVVYFFLAQLIVVCLVCLVLQNAPNILWGCLDPRNIQLPTPNTVSEDVWSSSSMFFCW